MKKIIFVTLFLIIITAVILPITVSGELILDEGDSYKVSRVIDGDTFEIKSGWKKGTVRMLGVNTPETVDPRKSAECFGKESSLATKNLLSEKTVKLRLNPNREEKDKYGRYLAYVYLEDNTFVNRYLLENGFAREYTFGKPYSMREDFIAIQNEAKQRGVGLWGKCGSEPS